MIGRENILGSTKIWLKKKLVTFLFNLLLFSTIAILYLPSCTFQPEDMPPLQLINNVLIDGQRLEFKAARFNLTGPISISSEDSHILAVLELSTDEDFEIPPNPGSSVYELVIYAVNEGYNLPTFPIQNGTFEVVEEETLEEADLNFLEGENFTSPIRILLSANNQGTWSNEIIGDEGTVQIQFDMNNELVRLTNNWSSSEGRQISGAVSLPLNLSNFRR